jgi:hypothetical protein
LIPNEQARRHLGRVICVGAKLTPPALAVALIVVSASIPFFAQPLAGNDDRLFVGLARNVLHYGWLGPYDDLTLVKGPLYPFFLALCFLSGLPFLAVQTALYTMSCLLLARTIGRFGRSQTLEFIAAILLLLNPAIFNLSVLHVDRDAIYVSLTMLVIAAALLCHLGRDAIPARCGLLAVGAGVALAALWLTREEGIWLLPPLLFVAAMHLAPVRSLGLRRVMRDSLYLAVIGGTAALCVGAAGMVNDQHYGVADVSEFKQTEFVAAYSALARITQAHPRPDVGFTRDSLKMAYAASPAAAELRPHMDGQEWPYLAAISCDALKVVPCDGEMHGMWLVWMLRLGTKAAGYYATAQEARSFYGRMAREIDTACANGSLACTAPRHSLLPPYHWRDIRIAIAAGLRMLPFIVTLDGWWLPSDAQLQIALPPVSCLASEPLPLCHTEGWFFDFLHMSLFVMPPSQLGPDGNREYALAQQASMQLPSTVLAIRLVRVLECLRLGFAVVLPWASALALICFAAGGVLQLSRRRRNCVWLLALLCMVIIVSRIALLAPLDAVMFPTVRVRYLEPIYPFVLLFCLMAPVSLWRSTHARVAPDYSASQS